MIISDEYFIEVCTKAKSMLDACTQLDMAMTTFKRKAIKLGCYRPNQGGKGSKKVWKQGIPLADILAGKYPEYQTYKLKIRLIKEGIKQDCCERCGWGEKPEGSQYTPCELHHKDGNPTNHLLSNLIMLCPNCHSLTKNYRFRKRVPEEKSSE